MKRPISLVLGLVLTLAIGMLWMTGCGTTSGGSSVPSGNAAMFLGGNAVHTYGGTRVAASGINSLSTSTISGAVKDAAGNPVNGVYIYAGGVNTLTSTDANGLYTASNVQTGMVTVCAIATWYPSAGYKYVQTIAAVTDQRTVDFTMGYGWPTAVVVARVLDQAGNPVEGARVDYKSGMGGADASNYTGVTDSSGYVTKEVSLVGASDTIFGIASKAGSGKGFTVGHGIVSGQTENITIILTTNEGTISGALTLPAGASGGSTMVLPLISLSAAGALVPLGSFTPDSSSYFSGLSYVATVPATSQYGMSANYNDDYISAIKLDVNMNIPTGSIYNIAFKDPIASLSGITYETGNVYNLALNWTRPSNWIPDLYHIFLYAETNGGGVHTTYNVCAFTDGLSIQLPVGQFSEMEGSYYMVRGVKTSVPVTANEFNSNYMIVTDFSGKKIYNAQLNN